MITIYHFVGRSGVYATDVLQMRKSKIDACELAATSDHTVSSEENVMEQDNAKVDDVDEQSFEMGLETDATIESLVTLTVYNWRSTDATDSLAFPAALHMWNSIRRADDNGESSALHCHLTQSNKDSGQIQASMGLISKIENDTTTLWHTITKAAASTTQGAAEEVGDDLNDCHESIQLPHIQTDGEFLPTLFSDIQGPVGRQQLDLIKSELGETIPKYNHTIIDLFFHNHIFYYHRKS